MRHQVYGRHLGRTSAHRTALKRNLASSLFEHGTIATTPQKAKFVKPFAEKMITLAKQGTLHARRQVISHLQNRDICQDENGETVKVDTVINKLFNEIAPRFSDRSGGYTRIIRLPLRRIGDNGQLVFLQLVDESVSAKTVPVETPDAATVDSTDIPGTEIEEKAQTTPVAVVEAEQPEAVEEQELTEDNAEQSTADETAVDEDDEKTSKDT